MSRAVLRAGSVATPYRLVQNAYVVIEDGLVTEMGSGPPPGGPVTDLGDRLLAPGFIDIHVHGGGGAQVNCATVEEVAASVRQMARFHATHGTTSLVASTVSDDRAALRRAVEGVAQVAGAAPDAPSAPNRHEGPDGQEGPTGHDEVGANVLGCHLEGPWISPARAGAQFPAAIREPSLEELGGLLDLARGTLRHVTIAPEQPGGLDLITFATSRGMLAAIGHTDADYETAVAAFEAGARNATHLFNAMAPIHHRHPGPVAASLTDERVSLEIIADGVHIHPALISMVATLAPDRLLLVTDAIGATGTAPGRHRLGPLEVLVSEGRAVLADHEETVAGSVLTMDRAVALAVQVAGVPLLTALRAASLHPANTIGEPHKGRLEEGAHADLVVLGHDLRLAATLVGGRVAHDPGGLLGPELPVGSQVPAP